MTDPPIAPLKTDDGDASSALVDMEMLAPAVGKSPIVKPNKVTKTTLFASTCPPDVVTSMWSGVGVETEPVK